MRNEEEDDHGDSSPLVDFWLAERKYVILIKQRGIFARARKMLSPNHTEKGEKWKEEETKEEGGGRREEERKESRLMTRQHRLMET